ncbi:hypothetical protein RFI_19996 [Reticulomyxa filosa]|uniref:Uncharacterized protein n=1 Tax=Reticulomyxa filosa TaxID=46433 RepID=X6MW51_RETFI|nr:hypothetical protein RFI_19996 [Reticulomyxa filosa]|eukprot:ETO17330.1 hypothetical protein RFI_19996 [Reticulomyxa filosa]
MPKQSLSMPVIMRTSIMRNIKLFFFALGLTLFKFKKETSNVQAVMTTLQSKPKLSKEEKDKLSGGKFSNKVVISFDIGSNVAKNKKKGKFKKVIGKGGASSSLAKPTPKEIQSPPSANVFKKATNVTSTEFRRFYDRGDLPLQVSFGGIRKVAWKIDIEKLDYHHYLPIFFDGLRETEEPYQFLATEGTKDLLAEGGQKLLPVVPQLIIPIKHAFNTKLRIANIHQTALIMHTVKKVGTIVPKSLDFFSDCHILHNNIKTVDCDDPLDMSVKKGHRLGALIEDTLEILEVHGGEDAFINIKYMIPLYESHIGKKHCKQILFKNVLCSKLTLCNIIYCPFCLRYFMFQ